METLEKNQGLTETQRLDNIIASSRRKMMTIAGSAIAGLVLSKFATPAEAQTVTDADILNFALNLEYLEAQFYTLATAGTTIDKYSTPVSITGGGGTAGTVTTKPGGPSACLVPWGTYTTIQAYAMETAKEERNHVNFISTALGPNAVAMPNIDLYNSFNGLAVAAGLGVTTFDPFANPIYFLLGAFIFEDVGVTAYSGAAPLITMPSNLDAAAGIQAVEAYHAGLVRTTLFGLDAANPSMGINALASKIAAARAKLDGTGSDDVGLGVVTTSVGPSSTIVDCDQNSLVYSRTTSQVLSIVYAGGAAGTGGGFFPNALNGTIK
jgi:hypothetical protein